MDNPRVAAMTRQHVIDAAASMVSKPVRKWGCMVPVNGTRGEYPVKQLFQEAANRVTVSAPTVTPADFTSHHAVARLKGLGFDVRYYG